MKLLASQAVFVAGLTAYLVVRAVYQRKAAGGEATVRRSSPGDRLLVALVISGQIIIPLVYLFSPLLDVANYQGPAGLVWLGALAWGSGMWVFWRSHADLGKNWSVSLELHRDHRLITHGIYRMVRHPMYSSFLLFAVAQALLLPNWFAGLSALISVGLLCAFRIPQEEAMMSEHFGRDYREYSELTRRLLPLPAYRGRDV